jgi:RNA polymerase sigma factor (sigma-70 family)
VKVPKTQDCHEGEIMQPNCTLVQECIERWSPLLWKVASQYSNKIASPEDLYQEGVLSIILGIQKFDEKRGQSSLNTYLFRCIQTGIRSASVRTSFEVNVPSSSLNVYKKLQKLARKTKKTCHEEIQYRGPTEGYMDLLELIDKHDHSKVAYYYFVEGKTPKEIAKKVGLDTSKISRLLKKIRRKLKRELI